MENSKFIAVAEKISEFAEKSPEKISVKTDRKSFTYKELNELSEKVAAFVAALGKKEEEKSQRPVAIFMEQSAEVFVAEIGIMKAGVPYLPLAASYPFERIKYCLEDSGACLLITTEEILNKKPELKALVSDCGIKVETIENILKAEKESGIQFPVITSETPLVVFYTSGSTGKPKGVMHTHGDLFHLITESAEDEALKEFFRDGGTVMLMTQISFVVSLNNLEALYHGLSVRVPSAEDFSNANKLAESISKSKVTSLFLTPSFFKNITGTYAENEILSSLKVIMFAGEKLEQNLIDSLLEKYPQTKFINAYGSTESCSHSCAKLFSENNTSASVGSTLPGIEAFILDEKGNPVQKGVTGELVIVTERICRGYIGQAASNSKAFIKYNGKSAFKTGDIAAFDENGEIQIRGRNDDMVKFHGQRIELGEIEAVIKEFGGIKDVKVLLRSGENDDFIAAFYVSDSKIDKKALRDFMKKSLAFYMIPQSFNQLEKMPLTASGKIDRMSLHHMEIQVEEEEYVESETEIEKQICSIVQELFCVKKVGVTANLISLGLTSLKAMKLSVQLFKEHKITVKSNEIIQYPTVRQIAALAENKTAEETKAAKGLEAVKSGNAQKDVYADWAAEKIPNVSIVSEEEKNQLIQLGRGPVLERDRSETILDIFRKRAASTPDATAVVFNDRKFTYAELDRISDKLAVHLKKNFNVSAGENVGVMINRSELMMVYPLAILKNGAAYMPLDPHFPTERLSFMCQDASVKVILSEGNLMQEKLPDFAGKSFNAAELSSLPEVSEKDLSELTNPHAEDRLVVLFTSGSTGTPKAVELNHSGIVNFCHWYVQEFEVTAKDKISAYANFGFDAHMMDLYPAILAGAAVYILPDEMRKDLQAVNDYIEKAGVTVAFFTTQVGCLIRDLNNSLRVLTVGGEKLPLTAEPSYRFVNGYGPTECSIYSTFCDVKGTADGTYIGRPLPNYQLYVVDQNCNLVPRGTAGELLIAGDGVAIGYMNRPEVNAEKFIMFKPDENSKPVRAYRSGDLVRWAENDNLQYIGRIDKQVKLRGLRIEPGEIENRGASFAGIKQIAVDVKNDTLCCYFVSESEINTDKLKAHIAEKLPEFMVPEIYMQLEAMPLNPNGKIDRRALPEPKFESGEIIAPETEIEKQICGIVQELCCVKKVGVTANLISLGLTSLKAMKLSIQLFKEYKIAVKSNEIIQNPTIRQIAALAEDKTAGETKAAKGLEAVKLGNAQKGVYADCAAEPDTIRYNLPYCVTIPEGYSAEQVKKAILATVNAHPSLKIRFEVNENDDIQQTIHEDTEFEIPVKAMSESDFVSYKNAFARPFNLTKENLIRFEIVQADKFYVLFDMHHLICDGSSISIFLEQFAAALDGVQPEKEEYTYIDYIKDEKITAETEEFYADRMKSVEEATQLIPDVYDGDDSHLAASVSEPTDLSAASAFATKIGVTPANVYLAAAFITAGRFVAEDTVSMVTISNGRSNLNIYNTMGMFVNTLPVVENIDNKEKTADFIKRVALDFAATINHENYPFAMIAKKYGFRPTLSFAYQVGVIDGCRTKNGILSADGLNTDIAKIPLSMFVLEDQQNCGQIKLEYDRGMYSEAMMKNFARSLSNVVEQLTKSKTLSEISLTDEEMCKELDSYNCPLDTGYDTKDSVVSKFRKIASQFPDKPAAVYKDKAYTYKELDELTDRMASVLYKRISEKTGKTNLAETVVSILIDRDENVFILPLAVMKTGCAYEPLDPSYPKDRLNFMVKDAGAVLLLVEPKLSGMVDEYKGDTLLVSDLVKLAEKPESGTKLPEDIKPADLMIMLYTSGSTGVPKGVQIQHGNLVSYAYGINKIGFYTSDGKTAAYASFGFDVCMSDTFCTLLNGATLYIISEDIRMELDKLAAYFDEVGITQIVMTTQVGVQFLENYPKLKTLRYLTMGGEKLPAVSPENLSYQINNGYGPTENCCGVSIFPIKHWESNIPIGKPFPTINGFVLDKTGHRLPAGAAGEYCVAGPQVSRGYLNRPEKTAEAYEKCPFIPYPMYHTGDIVRYRSSGDVEFVGRKDGQVKIRGFRVETKEVEAVIRKYPEIADVTVQAFSFESGGKYLAAYVVGKTKLDIAKITEFIRSEKPAYMVPSVIMQIEKIPLTVNQKVDKKALPKPEVQATQYVAPEGKVEEDFCQIFAKVSGREKIGALDDFFEIGGSSILAMKVVIAASKLGYRIVYKNVFSYTTPRDLAAFVQNGNPSAEGEKKFTLHRVSVKADSGQVTSITETDPEGYDYSKINALLRGNTLDAFRNGQMQPVKDVLLAGATGYLGIHVLKELLDNYEGKIYCVVRRKGSLDAEKRLKTLLYYYFASDYSEKFNDRIVVVEGDITEKSILDNFKPAEKNLTVINCAACVKHFAHGDLIERMNIESVRNLIEWCLRENARLVHVSTGSVAGSTDGKTLPQGYKIDEHVLYAGQIVDTNQYIHSKFIAERMIYEAILQKGLNAKVLRAGNLAPRDKDGEFQVNFNSNNFMASLKAYKVLGMISYDAMDSHIEFSPIDCTARAMLLLAGTPEKCVCFMASNQHRNLMGDVVMLLSQTGSPMRMVEAEEFQHNIEKAMNDPVKCDAMRPMMAYAGNDSEIRGLGYDDIDVSYTAQVLYRLGFRWPEVSQKYVEKFIRVMNELGFFDI